MPLDSANSKHAVRSLNTTYLTFSAIIISLILGCALIAFLYINSISKENAAALQLRDRITNSTRLIRNAVRSIDINLQGLLIRPKAEHESNISDAITQAQNMLSALAAEPAISDPHIKTSLINLRNQLNIMSNKLLELINLRQDTSWVYPTRPFISNTLLDANQKFEDAANLALNEIEDESDIPGFFLKFKKFDVLSHVWHQIILNFRTVLIRYPGLQTTDTTVQENNINQLYEVLKEKLLELKRDGSELNLGIQAEESMDIMFEQSARWYTGFRKIAEIRRSYNWRSDVTFIKLKIRPEQDKFFNRLSELENAIADVSDQAIDSVNSSATKLGVALWIIVSISILFIISIYISLQKRILKPIRDVATALSFIDEKSPEVTKLNSDALEVQKLVSAFSNMRNQVRSRQLALEYQAKHDMLTGLPNRIMLLERLKNAMVSVDRTGDNLGLLMLDLDRFKDINDTLGHSVGDEILQQIGMRLSAIVTNNDTVARLGGDEFAIIIARDAQQNIIKYAEKIGQCLNKVFHIGNYRLYIGLSIGMALYPENGHDTNTLLRHADIAMYHAKNNNMPFSFYTHELNKHSIAQLELVNDLRFALDRNELTLHYQPKIHIVSGEIAGFEALLRWQHPIHGWVTPEHIINIAEHTGQIGRLTSWVITSAITQCFKLNLHHTNLSMSINLSASNLQDHHLPELLQHVMNSNQVSPNTIVLEITETAMMTDPENAREVLDKIASMGILLSVDDFGTGFSSLAYLKTLPVTELKIDRSFVTDMLRDGNDRTIVHSTIELAHNLGLQVVAEGVQDSEVLDKLMELGCDVAQGFYISKPLAGTRLESWIENYRQPVKHKTSYLK